MGNWKKKLATFTELPQMSFGGCRYVEIESNSSVKIDGCTEILAYDNDEATFLTKEGLVTVNGSGLEICSYGNCTVRLVGEITGVFFGEISNA